MDRRAGLQAIWEQQTGTLQPLGQIAGSGGTAVNNSTTATPFVIPQGGRLVLQWVSGSGNLAFIATPDVDSGATLTPTTTGAYPQLVLGQLTETCMFAGGGQGTGHAQGTIPPSTTPVPTISCISAAAFVVNVFRLR